MNRIIKLSVAILVVISGLLIVVSVSYYQCYMDVAHGNF